MADIASKFGWNYVSTLADDGNYGEKGVGAFEEKAKHHGKLHKSCERQRNKYIMSMKFHTMIKVPTVAAASPLIPALLHDIAVITLTMKGPSYNCIRHAYLLTKFLGCVWMGD